MPHTDLVIKELEIVHEGTIDFKDFLKFMKGFMEKYDYDIEEKSYETKTKNGLKNTTIKWVCDRKIDDYNKILIKPKILLNDYKEGSVDGRRVTQGELIIKIKVEIERDYDEEWKGLPIIKFFRSIYEKYISESKQAKVDSESKDIVNKLRTEINQYFGE